MTVLACGRRNDGIDELVKREAVSGVDGPIRGALRLLMPQTFHRELYVRTAQRFIALAGIELEGPVCIGTGHCAPGADVADIKLFSLPGLESPGNLFGKAIGIGCGTKSLSGEDARCLMITVAVAI